MDAFFAAAEQASKPSLRGKPVIVGGLGPRGVVSTASYEARRFGVHSAMPMAQARRLCPNAAYLVPRFQLYRTVSEQVMELLRPAVAAGRAAEPGRGLRGPGSGRGGLRVGPAAREAGERLRGHQGGHGADRVGRARRIQDAGQDRLGAGQAGRARAHRTGHGAGAPRPDAGAHAAGRGPGHRRASAASRDDHGRRPRRGGRGRARTAAGKGARGVAVRGWRPGTTTGRWWPSGTPSRCRWRTPSTWTCTTGCGSRRRSARLADRCVQRLRAPGARGARWCSRCAATTSRR